MDNQINNERQVNEQVKDNYVGLILKQNTTKIILDDKFIYNDPLKQT